LKGGVNMSKWVLNYDSGEYEEIDKDGFSITRGEYVYNWDDSEYQKEEEGEEERDDMNEINFNLNWDEDD